MKIGTSCANQRQVPFISLVPFLLITFGFTWGIFALFILLPELIVAMFGELTDQYPLFFLAVYAPAIAAFIVSSPITVAREAYGVIFPDCCSGVALWLGMSF